MVMIKIVFQGSSIPLHIQTIYGSMGLELLTDLLPPLYMLSLFALGD